jgi:hypothetical protein
MTNWFTDLVWFGNTIVPRWFAMTSLLVVVAAIIVLVVAVLAAVVVAWDSWNKS